jgi:hypothetical protein
MSQAGRFLCYLMHSERKVILDLNPSTFLL